MTSGNGFDEDGPRPVWRIASLDIASLLRSRPSSPALSTDSGKTKTTSLIQSIDGQLKRGSPVNFNTLVRLQVDTLIPSFHLTVLPGSCVGRAEKSEWCWS